MIQESHLWLDIWITAAEKDLKDISDTLTACQVEGSALVLVHGEQVRPILYKKFGHTRMVVGGCLMQWGAAQLVLGLQEENNIESGSHSKGDTRIVEVTYVDEGIAAADDGRGSNCIAPHSSKVERRRTVLVPGIDISCQTEQLNDFHSVLQDSSLDFSYSPNGHAFLHEQFTYIAMCQFHLPSSIMEWSCSFLISHHCICQM